MGHLGSTEDIASLVSFLASKESRFITGTCNPVFVVRGLLMFLNLIPRPNGTIFSVGSQDLISRHSLLFLFRSRAMEENTSTKAISDVIDSEWQMACVQ